MKKIQHIEVDKKLIDDGKLLLKWVNIWIKKYDLYWTEACIK